MSPDELASLIEQVAPTAPDEVVTHALSQDVALPRGAGTAVLITLDNGQDHRRPNTLGPRGLAELAAAIDAAAARSDIVAIALTGKPYVLAAGADLSAFAKLRTRDQALAIARIGHAVYDKLRTAPMSTFALINGLALGGGLELALHCRYRTVSAAAAGIGLPECFLGLLPGWGGAYLLPNLIGADRAVKVIIENSLSQNRMLDGRSAHELGIADAMFESADFLERSLDWVSQVVLGTVDVVRQPLEDEAGWAAAVARGRAFADAKVSGAAPAPYRALDLIAAARTADRTAAYAAEDEGLADLVMGPELRASLYAFDLVRRRARKPAGAPDPALARPVTKIGVVGAGLMATQLALLFLRYAETPVLISDLDQDRLDAGLARIHGEIDRLVGKRRISAGAAGRMRAAISGTTSLAAYADCDFVIEAVFEEIAVKQQVFAELERHVSPECILATNTSSLSIAEMAADLAHPERLIGCHFFNPVSVMPLLEIIRGPQTDDPTTATALSLAAKAKKNAVLVSDAAGFVVNRLLLRLMAEVFAAVDEGTPIPVADAALRPLGTPMSPYTLLQLVGPGVALHVGNVLHDAFGDRFPVSPSLQAIVSAGLPGVYRKGPDGGQELNPDALAVIAPVVRSDSPSTAEQVRERTLAGLAEEITLMLDEGVVAAPADIDLCMILGAGWPFHLGGITPYLTRLGLLASPAR